MGALVGVERETEPPRGSAVMPDPGTSSTLRKVLDAIRRYGPLIAISAATIPIVCTFAIFEATLGAADAFYIPHVFVKADSNRLYEAAMWAIVIILLYSIPVLASVAFIATKFEGIKKPRRKPNVYTFMIGAQLFISILAGLAVNCLADPSGDGIEFVRGWALFSAIILGISLIATLAYFASTKYSTSQVDVDRKLMRRLYAGLGVVILGSAVGAGSYYLGFSSAREAPFHFVIPAHNPEIVLFMSSDGFATEEYSMKEHRLTANHRWHEWKEPLQMRYMRTGALYPETAKPLIDSSL